MLYKLVVDGIALTCHNDPQSLASYAAQYYSGSKVEIIPVNDDETEGMTMGGLSPENSIPIKNQEEEETTFVWPELLDIT